MTKSGSRAPHVLVYDSGVGGLSILDEIRLAHPGLKVSYLSDNDGFPYGRKPSTFVIERCLSVLKSFRSQTSSAADILVIACNTASTLALPALREEFSEPVVGVVPAIKPAAEYSANRYIGLLATPATIRRPYTQQLIQDFAKDCHLVMKGSSSLVDLAESKLRQAVVNRAELRSVLRRFREANAANPHPEKLDCLVLACTHFPLLADEIQDFMGPQVRLLDSGEAIARRVGYWLSQLGLYTGSTAEAGDTWFTRESADTDMLARALKTRMLNPPGVLRAEHHQSLSSANKSAMK
ncbi:glutamate racemase [Gilvimarinus algae]|uniref:Glutamate racemase n=1 Tax=Gilvimarinus algae TaxID=3058037 RepID=A0ABT8TGK4_9GAMM|nr:glutamate racemase [Gilvimarinus sp. SDUM040014]MDO3382523.1 glutamate racemase [Gilvimarinus sp. SDUM040014]